MWRGAPGLRCEVLVVCRVMGSSYGMVPGSGLASAVAGEGVPGRASFLGPGSDAYPGACAAIRGFE